MAWDWGNAGGGAVAGAGAGSRILPGWGTAIGGAAGGLLGGLTGGKGGGPTPPDFMALGQGTTNTPWSQQSTTIGPDGKPTTNFALTGDAGKALTAVQANMLRAAGMDPTQARDQAINQNMGFAMSRLQPKWDEENRSLASSMANSGIDPGTMAGNSAARQLGNQQSDQFSTALTTALNMGNQTQQTQMNQSMIPFQQNASLIDASMQQPNSSSPLVAAGMQYGADRNSAAGQQGAKSGMMSGISGLGSGKGGGGKGGGDGSMNL